VKEIAGRRIYDRLDEILERSHTALVVVDMQNDFCSVGGHFARHRRDISGIGAIVPVIQDLVAAARSAGVLVVYTRQTTLPDSASDSPAWLYFKTRDGKSPDYTTRGTWGAEFIDALAPGPDVPIVEKHRPSAFLHTDLELLLRSHGVETVVVAGCVTQGCVQATTTDASYHDFYAVVVGDAVASTDVVLHRNALAFLSSRYDVVDTADIMAIWSRSASGS